jgi:hypothetical protein
MASTCWCSGAAHIECHASTSEVSLASFESGLTMICEPRIIVDLRKLDLNNETRVWCGGDT